MCAWPPEDLAMSPPPDEKVIQKVVQLEKEGMKRRAIGRALKISRNTVREILEEHDRAREEPHTALPVRPGSPRPSKLDPFRKRIEKLLETYRTSPRNESSRFCADEEGFTGQYFIVKVLVRRMRPKKPPQPSLETPPRVPGDMAECDWSEYPVDFTHAAPMRLQAFGYVLRWSTRNTMASKRATGCTR